MPKDDDKPDASQRRKQGLSSEEETLWDELMGDVTPLERQKAPLKKDTGKETRKDTVVEDFADADSSDAPTPSNPQTPPDMSYFEAFVEGKINLADILQEQQPQDVIHQIKPENTAMPPASSPTAGNPKTAFTITENSAHKLAGYRAGLDSKTFKNLARGRVNPSLDVDLHGMTLMAAYAELRVFLAHSRAEGHKCVLIIHGKGRRDGREMGTIKQNLAGFLAERPEVRAFHTAHTRHGGSGACYVLIRRG